METNYLPEAAMLPQIQLARLYDTQKEHILRKTAPRVADSYELGIYLSDGGTLTIDDICYPIKCGDVRFLRPGNQVYSQPPYRCLTIFFHLGEQGVRYSNALLDALPPFFSAGSGGILHFEQIVRLFVLDEPGSVTRQNALLLLLLTEYYQLLYSSSRYRSAVRECISYMEEHLDEKITLEHLGSLTGYSALHVLRIFKEDTQKTPHDLLSALRMARAKELLNNTTVPISRIAAECGFHSESHFQAIFKKLSGVTPGSYRKSARHLL